MKEEEEEEEEEPKNHTGTNTKFKHINIKYPFHARFSINVGVIITTKKFHSQLADMPIACLYHHINIIISIIISMGK